MISIFHSDDCGLTKEGTDAIIKAINAKAIGSTSLMLGAQYTQYAAEKLRETNGARIGIHLNLLEGKPSANPADIKDLINSRGYFNLSLIKLWRKTLFDTGKLKDQILTEFTAQIKAFKEIFPDIPLRIDGHLHVHCMPTLRDVMREIFNRFTVEYVRIPYELDFKTGLSGKKKLKALLRRKLLNKWSNGLKTIIPGDVKTPDFFIGSALSAELNIEYLENAFSEISAIASDTDIVEVMLHLSEAKYNLACDWYDNAYKCAHFTNERKNELDMVLSERFNRLQKNIRP